MPPTPSKHHVNHFLTCSALDPPTMQALPPMACNDPSTTVCSSTATTTLNNQKSSWQCCNSTTGVAGGEGLC